MLLVVVYLYVASAAKWAMNIWNTLTGIHGLLMVPDVPVPDRLGLVQAAILKVGGVQEAIFDFNMVIVDSVVVWRTWAVYQHRVQRRILAILVPGTLLLLTFIFVIIDTVSNNYYGAARLPGVFYLAWIISWGLSAATNITCTVFIGLKARQHRKIIRPLGKPSRMSGEKALSILFDSGFIYSLLWLSQVISLFDVTFGEVIEAMGNQIAGFYPTLIIVIVNLRRTIWEEEEESRPVSSRTLNAKRSGMTDTLGSQRGDDAVHVEGVLDITSDSKHPRV
ncbi:hypothetical protein B0H11DRAFT_2309455 [Mycena galericulata]|nr:hypothetical protein B0H11DRAFT_2309455 [Mycena galericulata]